MRKFECRRCAKTCTLLLDENLARPRSCIYGNRESLWFAIKEDSAENEQFGNSEQLPSNPRKLPDWVKVGEYMYLSEKGKYFKITEDFMNVNLIGEKITAILAGKIKQAKKRPFNAEEMKALVGKIIQKDNDIGVVMHYFGKDNEVLFCNSFATSEDLMNNNCVIYSTGKPCFKLEHLNENGKWVE